MSKLILMRHGQASFGSDRYDALSELGTLQARATGQWMKAQGTQVDRLVHGPRQRQRDSASLLREESGVSPCLTQHGGLDEFAEGEEIFKAAEACLSRPMDGAENRSRLDVLRDYDSTCKAWGLGKIELAGRLSIDDFRIQVRQWFESLSDQPDAAGQQIVAVTSAGVIAAVVCEVLELPNEKWHSLLRVIGNASLTEILFTKERRSLSAFNGMGHLPKDLISSM